MTNHIKKPIIHKKWKQWLAGLIDGDGHLGITKDGYAFLEITMGLQDSSALAQIKQKLGGSLKLRSNAKGIRYRLKSKPLMIDCINLINGEIRNTVRVEQLKKVCDHLELEYVPPSCLTKDNGYTAGVFDADGTITISVHKIPTNVSTLSGVEGQIQRLSNARGFHQLTAKISNKYECNVSLFKQAFSLGTVICDNSRNSGPVYDWYFRGRVDMFEFLEYIKKYPLRSAKKKRVFLIQSYFNLINQKAHLAPEESMLRKAWKRFCRKWF